MIKGSAKGQVTVFLCIILMALMITAGILVDIARIANGEAQAKRAVLSAVKSSLADYDTKLKEDYGIFAIYEGDASRVKLNVEDYIKRNLMIGTKEADTKNYFHNSQALGNNGRNETKYLDIYNFRIENLDVAPVLNLSENENVKGQILQYMKYRAPKEMIEGIWDRLSAVKVASSISEAYKMRYEADKLLGRIDKVQQNLKISIDGSGSCDEIYVNGFNRDGSRKAMVYRFADKASECCSLKESLSKIEVLWVESARKLTEIEDAEEKKKLKASIDELEKSARNMQSQLEASQSERDSMFMDLKNKHTIGFIYPNAQAENSIRKMSKIAKDADEAVTRLEKYINEKFKVEGEMSASFKSTCEADIIKLKKLAASGKEGNKLLADVTGNQQLLHNAAISFDQVQMLLETQQDPGIITTKIIDLLDGNLEEYKNGISYDYERPVKQDNVDDPRKGLPGKMAESLKSDKKEDRNMKKAGIDIEQLPSRKKIKSPAFELEDSEYLESMEYTKNNEGSDMGAITYNGNLTKVDREADLDDEEGSFAENAFGFLGSMGKLLGRGLSGLADEIYINEYIMGTFKNSVPVIKHTDNHKKDLDLRGLDKSKRDTFFESEVEYILHGNSSESINKLMTKSQILLIRFGMNTIHVYTDPKKKEMATAVASAVAGWWTGGAGIPVLSNLIMCSWGMGEALIDLKDIMDGKTVPFYKNSGDWKLDIGISASDGRKTDMRLHFSYHDYLRLLLLLKNSDEKISMVEDLIQLNIQKGDKSFKMAYRNTCLRIEAQVSIRYLFFTGIFIPDDKKTKDGRHLVKVVLYEGY